MYHLFGGVAVYPVPAKGRQPLLVGPLRHLSLSAFLWASLSSASAGHRRPPRRYGPSLPRTIHPGEDSLCDRVVVVAQLL